MGGYDVKEKLFDTAFETSLRLTLLFDELVDDVSADYIQVIDFMSLYSKSFSIGNANINGENPFMFSEYAARRETIQLALKELVLKGYIKPIATNEGFFYCNTFKGHQFAQTLRNSFAEKYRLAIKATLSSVEGINEKDLIAQLNQKSKQKVERLTR